MRQPALIHGRGQWNLVFYMKLFAWVLGKAFPECRAPIFRTSLQADLLEEIAVTPSRSDGDVLPCAFAMLSPLECLKLSSIAKLRLVRNSAHNDFSLIARVVSRGTICSAHFGPQYGDKSLGSSAAFRLKSELAIVDPKLACTISVFGVLCQTKAFFMHRVGGGGLTKNRIVAD
tara:strand:+ start:361 stop:882 length:522 start_codon:yes stop_codon:yes gene_type:complete